MQIETFRKLYKQELEKLKIEIQLYHEEENLWVRDKQIANSAGNLCLHLIGNLNHFIGSVLGQTEYIRNRELEFIIEDISRDKLIISIQETIDVVDSSLRKLSDSQLKDDYPIKKFTNNESIEFLLVHSLMHFTYHLGQINYHRRLLDY
tara:strand:+ start:1404 stop:1850 length:447 start_codon:yes stop_codon:yes gene_type:complete